jgi:hypothetical protein
MVTATAAAAEATAAGMRMETTSAEGASGHMWSRRSQLSSEPSQRTNKVTDLTGETGHNTTAGQRPKTAFHCVHLSLFQKASPKSHTK